MTQHPNSPAEFKKALLESDKLCGKEKINYTFARSSPYVEGRNLIKTIKELSMRSENRENLPQMAGQARLRKLRN